MTTPSWFAGPLEAVRATRAGCRAVGLAGLLAAGLLLAPPPAGAEGPGGPPAAGARRESPYARYARDHAKSTAKKPGRVRPTSSVRPGPRAGASGGRP